MSFRIILNKLRLSVGSFYFCFLIIKYSLVYIKYFVLFLNGTSFLEKDADFWNSRNPGIRNLESLMAS